MVIHRGAGAYICGEETALLTSLEGGKGFPKLKPPFPAISGLFQCPTIVNNVETLACVPFILREGAERFAGLGTARQGGTRLFSVCGHVNRPGLYEAPVGVTLRELIEGYAQGVRDGRKLKAVDPRRHLGQGAHRSGDRRPHGLRLADGGRLDGRIGRRDRDGRHHLHGRGAAVARRSSSPTSRAASALRAGKEPAGFTASCDRIAEGKGRLQDLDDLLAIARDMEGKTICVFADAAAWPVQSYITKFRDGVRRAHPDRDVSRCEVERLPACRP